MNPTLDTIGKIQAYVPTISGAWANTNDQLVTAANAPLASAPQVPKPFGFGDVLNCLSPGSIANVRSLPTALDLIDKVNAGDVAGITHWLTALQAGTPLITTAEAAAINTVLTATIPDPRWTPTASWAQTAIGRPLDDGDFAAARPSS